MDILVIVGFCPDGSSNMYSTFSLYTASILTLKVNFMENKNNVIVLFTIIEAIFIGFYFV